MGVRFALSLCVLVGVVSCVSQVERFMSDRDLQLYYFPFHLETFTPIVVEDIESRARCRLELPGASSEAAKLREILAQSEEGKFNDQVVRLKVIGLDNGDVYVDRDGGMLARDAGVGSMLGSDAFARLQQLVEQVGINQGCDVR